VPVPPSPLGVRDKETSGRPFSLSTLFPAEWNGMRRIADQVRVLPFSPSLVPGVSKGAESPLPFFLFPLPAERASHDRVLLLSTQTFSLFLFCFAFLFWVERTRRSFFSFPFSFSFGLRHSKALLFFFRFFFPPPFSSFTRFREGSHPSSSSLLPEASTDLPPMAELVSLLAGT